jgi:hypothetical protein
MADYTTILHATEIQEGPQYVVHADHLIDNFNGIISAFQDRLNLTSVSTQTINGLVRAAGGIDVDTITENTTGNGTSINNVLLKGGTATLSGTPSSNGQIGYAGNQFQGQRNGTLKNFLMSGDATAFPTGYITGLPPSYTSSSTITIPQGLDARDGQDFSDIRVASPITLSLVSSGAAGLDTGTVASNTFYYVYLIQKSSDATVSAIFSVTNEAASGTITLPSGYDLKRQLPFFVLTDSSTNIRPFSVAGGWPKRPEIQYLSQMSGNYSGSFVTGVTNVLVNGSATTYTGISLSNFVPPICKTVTLSYTGNSTYTALRPTGGSDLVVMGSASTFNHQILPSITVGTGNSIDYKNNAGGGSVSFDIYKVTVTEVS